MIRRRPKIRSLPIQCRRSRPCLQRPKHIQSGIGRVCELYHHRGLSLGFMMNMHARCVLRLLLDDAVTQATSNDAHTSNKLCTDAHLSSFSF